MLAFSTVTSYLLTTTSWIPTVYAVTATTWGAVRYFSSNGCQPSSLLYIESFPLNVCYKTGNLPYYKMNTVTKGGTIGCLPAGNTPDNNIQMPVVLFQELIRIRWYIVTPPPPVA